MAGSISLSLSQQFDSLGKPLSGGLLYTYAAGTTNPQSAYQDVALTIPWPNPITLDGAGRVPPFYLADGQIKIRLTDKFGILQIAADNLLVVGASSGTGTPPSVDATTLIQTGWIQPVYGTGPITGFVRLNGRTLGSASSGATERANADTASLFAFLYQQDTTLAVSGGRGASATADFSANKTIALPDARGKVFAGIDDMGAGDSGTLASVPFITGSQFTLGSKAGAGLKNIAQNNLPNVAPTFTGTANQTVSVQTTNSNVLFGTVAGTGQSAGSGQGTLTGSGFASNTATSTGIFTAAGSVSSINGNVSQAGLPILQPTLMVTLYIKL
jgi:hypothetical protein